MNLYERRTELIQYIDQLQNTANKHKKNQRIRIYRFVCGILEEQREQLKKLNDDIVKRNLITSYRIKNVQHDQN